MTLAHDSRRRIRMWNKLGSHGEGGGLGGGGHFQLCLSPISSPFSPFLSFSISPALKKP